MSADDMQPGPDVECPKCGLGRLACDYCHHLDAGDWEAICDCGLLSHGFHLLSCDITHETLNP